QAEGNRHLEMLVIEIAEILRVTDDAAGLRSDQQRGDIGAVVEFGEPLRERGVRLQRQLHDRPVAHQAADHQRLAVRDRGMEIERERIALLHRSGLWCGRGDGVHGESAARTAAKNARNLSWSLMPGADSTPLARSTANGRIS